MSIEDRVTKAVESLGKGEPESALHDICSAVDMTATILYGKPGKESYKNFIHDNSDIITKISLGASILNLRMSYDHPRIKKDNDGYCSLADVFYHAVRCALYHTTDLSSSLRLEDGQQIRFDGDTLILPASFVDGLIAAVVACPVNKGLQIDPNYGMVVFSCIFLNWEYRDLKNLRERSQTLKKDTILEELFPFV